MYQALQSGQHLGMLPVASTTLTGAVASKRQPTRMAICRLWYCRGLGPGYLSLASSVLADQRPAQWHRHRSHLALAQELPSRDLLD